MDGAGVVLALDGANGLTPPAATYVLDALAGEQRELVGRQDVAGEGEGPGLVERVVDDGLAAELAAAPSSGGPVPAMPAGPVNVVRA